MPAGKKRRAGTFDGSLRSLLSRLHSGYFVFVEEVAKKRCGLPISAVDAIGPAFQHAKQQLIGPFRFGQWVRLAFVGLLAGEAGSGGGCNFNFPAPHRDKGSEHFPGSLWPAMATNHREEFVAVVILLVVAGFGLVALFMYISSVMRFILFDSVVAKECHIRQGWIRRRQQGLGYFVWQILLGLVALAAGLVLVGLPLAFAWAAGWFVRPSEHLLPLILGGVILFFLIAALVVTLSVVHVLTKDFVVPQMALEDIAVMEGWRRLWLWIKAEKGGYAGYIGMKIVLALGAAIALGIIGVMVLLILLIPIGGAGVAAVLAGAAAGLTWNFFTIALVVIAGCMALAVLMFVASLISVPATVFFPAYSIYFFAPRYPPLAAALWPQPAAPVLPPQFPEPPPLPPAPA